MNVISPSKRRNEVITIRSTSHEKEIINHKASLCGKTVSNVSSIKIKVHKPYSMV